MCIGQRSCLERCHNVHWAVVMSGEMSQCTLGSGDVWRDVTVYIGQW